MQKDNNATSDSIFSDYNSIGFTPIPFYYKSKIPSIEWKDYQNSKPTNDSLSKWDNEKCNIGFVTGQYHNIFVISC